MQLAILDILNTMARRAPTIICLEDLHWADPSSLELFRFLLSDFRYPALVICVYRPTLTLLSNQQIANLGESYEDIRLEDLSPAETGTMVGSLLKTEQIPADLEHFLRNKAGGNPFYLEEIINSLVETKTLESAGQIGANATLGRAYRDWGRLYQEKGDTDKAAECFAQANTYLRLCGSEALAEHVVDDKEQETRPDIAEHANNAEIINSHLNL